jgi:ParB family chromosome partitioning protein
MAKATKKQALGRGLSALLNDPAIDFNSAVNTSTEQQVGSITELNLKLIEVNPNQPRTSFNQDSLSELASSIKELGVIQPITVRKIGSNKYQLVSGERRLRASILVGLETIPAYIRIANDQESLEMALVENIQRQDLDPIEIALSYQRLLDEINITQDKLSLRVGKNRSTIANYLRLLKLDPIIQTGMRDGFISMGHGRALINIENLKDQLEIYKKILSSNLSVRATESLVKEYKSPSPVIKQETIKLPSFAIEVQKELSEFLDSNVKISSTKKGSGKFIVPFKDKEELDRILNLIKSEK